MGKSIRAIITPEVLVWARTLDNFTIEEAALRLNVDSDKIRAWENGQAYPTLRQAKELAKYYRVPFVTLYLPDPPKKPKRIDRVDYRTFGNVGDSFVASRELRWLLRDIEDRRDSMIELYSLNGRKPKIFPLHMSETDSVEDIAIAIRKLLGLTPEVQKNFRKSEKALAFCINVLERQDVLVFQAAKIAPNEMRGLSLGYSEMPIIVLNRKDEYSARLFSLIHEVAHIVLNNSGVCNEIGSEAISKNQAELFCNKIAGLVLAPIDEIKKHPAVQNIVKYGFDDTYINAMARDFAVSKEVILYHIFDLDIISKSFYFETLERYKEEYRDYASKKKGGMIPPAIDKGTQVGRLYAKTVLDAYHNDRISTRDASAYLLNLGVKHFGSVERWCL